MVRIEEPHRKDRACSLREILWKYKCIQ